MAIEWFFPTRGYGETEGLSNPGIEMFKGEPIRAMAREICQNSLDAAVRGTEKPVRVEFEKFFISVTDFPGMEAMRDILEKCREFWKDQNDNKTERFIKEAAREIAEGQSIFVLRVSDYNTTGLKGAFSEEKITPWKSLVQGNAFSVKNTDSAAGSYGIGKAAPFVVSKLQTVFYRTYDVDGERAAQGVTHLVAFEDEEMALPGEDTVRRSTGYYGDGVENRPFKSIKKLDEINMRTEPGTDLFIPAFSIKDKWEDEIVSEILENFLYSIYSEQLEVIVDKMVLNKHTMERYIKKLWPKTKHAASFYGVIREDNDNTDVVFEEIREFYLGGNLRLRLLYKNDMNKKVLVVRNSGMKIAEISRLPKGISYTGFLEIQGGKLNAFFREMENPQHNQWEPKRHRDAETAKKYKKEVEEWVKEMINSKIKEISGDEVDIDVGEYFNSKENEKPTVSSDEKREGFFDSETSMQIIQENMESKKRKVGNIEGNSGSNMNMVSGIIDDEGDQIGHRHRSGSRSNAQPTGRRGFSVGNGPDKIYNDIGQVPISVRIINKGNGINRMVFYTGEDISTGELEIVTVGENGKMLRLQVKSVKGVSNTVETSDGRIKIHDVKAKEKNILEFSIYGNSNYALGVRAYENNK